MASFSQLSALANVDDPADLFAAVYDLVQAEFADMFLEPQKVRGLLKAGAGEINAIADAVLARTLDAAGLEARISGTGDPDREALLVVAALDEALAQASPWTRRTTSQVFNDLRARFLTNGRLNERTDGAVLPRRSWPGRPANAPERLAFALQHTVRVSAADWQHVELEVVPAGLDFSEGELANGLRIVCIPVLEDAGEMSFQATAEQTYIIEPKDTPALRSRLERVVASLDASGAQLAVLPELTLTPDLLAYWRELVRRVPRPSGSRLRWILAGSGAFPAGAGALALPYNQAHLIERDGGAVLLSQAKRAGFTMTTEILSDWQLPLPTTDQLDENITLGGKLHLLESRAGRFAIMICEDLARTIEQAPLTAAVNASRVLVPTFSDLMTEYYWEHQAARQLATNIGSDVLVSNSRVVANAQGKLRGGFGPNNGTALRVSPQGFVIAGSNGPAEPVIFDEV